MSARHLAITAWLLGSAVEPAAASEPAALASPLVWEPTVRELVALVRDGQEVFATSTPALGPAWSPSDLSVTYSFRVDGDTDSARSRTDAFDEVLSPDGVDLRWSEGRSNTEVHYVTFKLDWDFDGRADAENKQRVEADAMRVKQRSARADEARKATDLFVERRSLQGDLLGRQLPTEQVWAKCARLAAINAELDLITGGGWQRLLAERAPDGVPRWLSGLDAD